MENCYVGNNPSYPDLWRASPLLKPAHFPAPSDVGRPGAVDFVNTFTMSPLDMDPLSNIFSLTSCPPTYKEFSVFTKEKGGHDIADALLSLKHAVVHPGMAGPVTAAGGAGGPGTPAAHGQLSPLSPGTGLHSHHYGHQFPPPPSASGFGQPAGSMAASMGTSPPTLSYTVSHQPQMMQGYPSMSSSHGQYHHAGVPPSQPPQYGDHTGPGAGPGPGQTSPSHGATANMFPAMSVNVSMSMNVGMPPGMAAGQCGPPPPPPPPPPHHAQTDQWMPQQPSAPPHAQPQYQTGTNFHHHSQPHPPQYSSSYGAHHQHNPYSASYSFSSELRGGMAKDVMFGKAADLDFKDPSRGYSPGIPGSPLNVKRSKVPQPCPGSRHGLIPDNAKINLCRICGKTYARPSTLKTHLRTHSGEKPYRCSTCGKSFSQAANLTAHLRTHSGEKPFRCPVCERRFSQSSSVTTHMRTHSGERPYRCRLCKKAFSDSSTLTKHLRIHSGEKPYQCKLCLLRFSQSGNLNRHMRVHTYTA